MATTAESAENQPLLHRESSSRLDQPTVRRQHSWHFVPSEDSYVSKNGDIPTSIRNDFIKKVYLILGVEIAWTAIICAVFMYWEPLRVGSVAFVAAHPLAFQISQYATLLPTLLALLCFKNKYPLNFYLTIAFVTLMGIYVGVICAIFQSAGKGDAILQAVIVTAVIFFTLTIYCHVSKTDFSFMHGYLYCSLFALIVLGIVAMVMQSPLITFLYQCAGVLLFTLYILYDTSQIIHHYGPDDYIVASVELYIDLINLFLYILSLLGDR